MRAYIFLVLAVGALMTTGCRKTVSLGPYPVEANLEHRGEDGSIFTPSTQSLLRDHHWFEGLKSVSFEVDEELMAEVTFLHESGEPFVLKQVPLERLVPRLYYSVEGSPTSFDALNLRLAEYSRNGIMLPIGQEGDAIAHFQTTLDSEAPYSLNDSYDFEPASRYQPVRVQIVNNCLRPGLWEFGAKDTAGEIYHAWFTLPEDAYLELVGLANGIEDKAWLAESLAWDEAELELDLDRLRSDPVEKGRGALQVSGGKGTSYSSQDSRRKLQKGFVKVVDNGEMRPPETLSDITEHPVRMTQFVEPGYYSSEDFMPFDLGFLRKSLPEAVFYEVQARTSYRPEDEQGPSDYRYLELHLPLEDMTLILGNLPLELLVPQQEFTLHGYGAGIMAASDFAERRSYLFSDGPAPSFAYLAREEDGKWVGLNSHAWGLEQIFIRPRFEPDRAYLEIVLTSYERIVDIIRYEVALPKTLVADFKAARDSYIPPLFYSYRDDNLL